MNYLESFDHYSDKFFYESDDFNDFKEAPLILFDETDLNFLKRILESKVFDLKFEDELLNETNDLNNVHRVSFERIEKTESSRKFHFVTLIFKGEDSWYWVIDKTPTIFTKYFKADDLDGLEVLLNKILND